MSDHYWLTEPQLERIKPYFPQPHGRPHVDDRRVISRIIHVIRNGLRWRDAPEISPDCLQSGKKGLLRVVLVERKAA